MDTLSTLRREMENELWSLRRFSEDLQKEIYSLQKDIKLLERQVADVRNQSYSAS